MNTLSEVCIANDRFHEVIIAFVKIEETPGGSVVIVRKRMCRNCGLWDTFIQEEHGGPDPYPPNPYGPGGARRRL
jgi:hypothetical protein